METNNAFMTNTQVGKRQYMVTYSQADAKKFPTRSSFGQALRQEFNSGSGKVKVLHWACAKENHREGGFHYHCCLKLSGVKKWLAVKRNFQTNHNVVLNFSDTHNHYISSYRYVCKEDREVFHSAGHPNLTLVGSPRTKACINAYRTKRKSTNNTSAPTLNSEAGPSSSTSAATPKRSKLTNLEVSDFIINNRIRSKTELYAMAQTRKQQGECDLAIFLFSRPEKTICELIEKSWLLNSASADMLSENTSRMEKIEDAARGNCEENCTWLDSALEVLHFNHYEPVTFAGYLHDLLKNGRGKWRNMMIVGRSNCAKTFILKPLKLIFNCFENPSNDKFAWVGADKADVILMQDFRYSKEFIAWKDLLLLLEGETVKLPAPKNHFINDIVIKDDVPVFATSKSKITFKGPYNTEDERETEMMDSRWRIIKFNHVFQENDQKEIKACATCFAKLVLMAQ